jgi:hypothetical protein
LNDGEQGVAAMMLSRRHKIQIAIGLILLGLSGAGIAIRSREQAESLQLTGKWIVEGCQQGGECVFIHGRLVSPGEKGEPDECERVDPAAGKVVKRWPVGSKWVDFPAHPENSGWKITCDNEPS